MKHYTIRLTFRDILDNRRKEYKHATDYIETDNCLKIIGCQNMDVDQIAYTWDGILGYTVEEEDA